MEITYTLSPLGPLLGARQRGQQHGGKDGDDGDDHQQLDQCEC